MSLPRSKSAPHPLSSLSASRAKKLNAKPNLALNSAIAIVDTPLISPLISPLGEVREDPFNLAGFFPSRPGSPPSEWDWLRSPPDEGGDVISKRQGQPFAGFDVPALEVPLQSTIPSVVPSDYLDDYAKEVIATEDKLGILSFSTKRMLSYLPKIPLDEMPPEMLDDTPPLTPFYSEDPVDHDALYEAQCLRREAHESDDTKEVASHGALTSEGLFLSSGSETGHRRDGWMSMLYDTVRRLAGMT